LNLSINQTPAHWYINIYPNQTNDVNLRWKTYFTGIPSQWSILFDDQNSVHDPIFDQDSADFVLFGQPDVVQKLIIGAHLNGTSGLGTVSFILYNPLNNTDRDTIHFHFNIHKVPVSVDDIQKNNEIYTWKENQISLNDNQVGNFNIYDEQGKLIQQVKGVNTFEISNLHKNKWYYIQLEVDKEYYILKIIN
jgi:hypothetical protein